MAIMRREDLKELIENNFRIGEDQKDISEPTSSHNACEYLKPAFESEIGIMSYNFPLAEWENQKWIDLLHNAVDNLKATIRIIGGPFVETKNIFEKLPKKNTELRIIPEPVTFHVLYVTNPNQLLIEEYHDEHKAINMHFTPKPHEHAWSKAMTLFNKAWSFGKPAQHFDDKFTKDITAEELIVIYLKKKKREVAERTFLEDLKNITDNLHKEKLANRIYFVEDPISKYWSREISYALRSLLSYRLISSHYKSGNIFYELRQEGKESLGYFKDSPSWKTLESFL